MRQASMLTHKHTPWFPANVFIVIIVIIVVPDLARWPNIYDVTCILTSSKDLRRNWYQLVEDDPVQGSSRSYKIPHNYHHNMNHSCLLCPPPAATKGNGPPLRQ
jgi:hypothetical protein